MLRARSEELLTSLLKNSGSITTRHDIFKIVECLFDYGSTPEEKAQNRQYACAGANALRYIIRKAIEPQKVLTPDEGESIATWAKREAEYRRQKTVSDTRSTVPEAKRSMKGGLDRRRTSGEASV